MINESILSTIPHTYRVPNKHQQLLLPPSQEIDSPDSFPETSFLSFPGFKAADSFAWQLKSLLQNQRKGLRDQRDDSNG